MRRLLGFGLVIALLVVFGAIVLSNTANTTIALGAAHAALAKECSPNIQAAVSNARTAVALSGEQRSNAATIIQVGDEMNIGSFGKQIAVATAMQESRLINVPYGDQAGPDSRGLFQQRNPWGPLEVRMNPAGASRLFYQALGKVPGWQQMPLWLAAQTVQRSAFPLLYQTWNGLATELVQQASNRVNCSQPEPAKPAHNNQAEKAIAFALAQRGLPYVWGGIGPRGYDCSGLIQQAWKSAGVALERVSQRQYLNGDPVLLAQAQPGDLIFWSYDGTWRSAHHVAMYLGNGRIVEAQQSGVPIHDRLLRLNPREPGLMPYAIRIRT